MATTTGSLRTVPFTALGVYGALARLGDLPGESLGDFGGLGDAAPFRDQTGNVGARGEEACAGQSLYAKSNRCFGHRVAEVASFRRNGSPIV